MNISIIGAGCVGSVIAEQLSSVDDVNVSFIANGHYRNSLENKGIIVNGKEFMIPICDKEQSIDLVFVCVKNYDLEQACNDLKEYIDHNTIILPLLNSVSPTPYLESRFPDNRVLYGYISKIDSFYDGYSFQYHIAGDMHFGYAVNRNITKELKDIKSILDKTNFYSYIDQDMVRGIWKKWMLNVGANQVSALTESNYIQFAIIPEIKQVLMLAMQELLIIASYEGVNLSTKDVIETIEYLTTYPYPKKTSMLQDIESHRKTEIDYISGDILKLSRKWNCPCPVNLTMYYLIKSKEKTYLESSALL